MPNSVMSSRETWTKVYVTIFYFAMVLLSVAMTRYQMSTLIRGLRTQGYVTDQQMEKCPDNMERWGMVKILKDAGRLSYKHFPLFLPFTLALYLPTSLLVSFQSTDDYIQRKMEYMQLPFILSYGKRHFTAAQQGDTGTQMVQPLWVTSVADFRSMLLLVTGVRLVYVAISSIVEFITIFSNYFDRGIMAEPSARYWQTIVKRLLKFPALALYRMLVTDLWLSFFKIFAAIALIGPVVILASMVIWISTLMGHTPETSSTWVAYLMLLPFGVVGFNYENLLFYEYVLGMLVPAHVLIKLEKYGRAAVRKNIELIKGHLGIFFCYLLVLGGLLTSLARWFEAAPLAMDSYYLPLWGWIICRSTLLSFLKSGSSAQYGVRACVSLCCSPSANQAQRASCIPL